jgi:hypothetical protein
MSDVVHHEACLVGGVLVPLVVLRRELSEAELSASKVEVGVQTCNCLVLVSEAESFLKLCTESLDTRRDLDLRDRVGHRVDHFFNSETDQGTVTDVIGTVDSDEPQAHSKLLSAALQAASQQGADLLVGAVEDAVP